MALNKQLHEAGWEEWMEMDGEWVKKRAER